MTIVRSQFAAADGHDQERHVSAVSVNLDQQQDNSSDGCDQHRQERLRGELSASSGAVAKILPLEPQVKVPRILQTVRGY